MQLTFTSSGYTLALPDTIQALSEAFGSNMMDAGELQYLAGTLAAYPWNTTSIVVEIGAFTGRTTVFMAKVLQLLGKHIPILSIDAFDRVQPDALNPQGNYAAYLETIRTNNFEDLCMPLTAFSQNAAPVVPDQIGVLVVDGGHSYPSVTQDLALYGLKVLPGGFVFIDDYGYYYPDVKRAVDEYFVPGCSFTILHKSHFIVAQRDARTVQSTSKARASTEEGAI